MGYYLYDANGYLSDGPSTTGMRELAAFLDATGDPVLKKFVDLGHSSGLPRLIKALERVRARGSVERSRVALLAAARRADAILILTDGVF